MRHAGNVHGGPGILARSLRQMPRVAMGEPETELVFFDPTGAGLPAPS